MFPLIKWIFNLGTVEIGAQYIHELDKKNPFDEPKMFYIPMQVKEGFVQYRILFPNGNWRTDFCSVRSFKSFYYKYSKIT